MLPEVAPSVPMLRIELVTYPPLDVNAVVVGSTPMGRRVYVIVDPPIAVITPVPTIGYKPVRVGSERIKSPTV